MCVFMCTLVYFGHYEWTMFIHSNRGGSIWDILKMQYAWLHSGNHAPLSVMQYHNNIKQNSQKEKTGKTDQCVIFQTLCLHCADSFCSVYNIINLLYGSFQFWQHLSILPSLEVREGSWSSTIQKVHRFATDVGFQFRRTHASQKTKASVLLNVPLKLH